MFVQTVDNNHPKYKTSFVIFSVANKNEFINPSLSSYALLSPT